MKKTLINGMIFIALVTCFGITTFAQSVNCSGKQLSLREAEGEADMGGKAYGNYVFTNISSSPCTLSGFPTFVLLNKAGQIMRGVKVTYTTNSVSGDTEEAVDNPKPSVVMLKPKGTAWFQISYNTGRMDDRKKTVPASAKVKVKAPNTDRDFVIKSVITAAHGVRVSYLRKGLPQ